VTRRLVFRPPAESELLHARSWYERQRAGLGRAFAHAVEDVLGSIRQTPLAYPSVRGETRRALVQRFPYAVYFRVLPDEIVVLAVMHGTAPVSLAVEALSLRRKR
jgi:plasmid stabilization system protein ParE